MKKSILPQPRRSSQRRTVAQAAREASKQQPQPPKFACFRTDILAGKSSRTRKGIFRHNLTTTIANDWLSRLMGMGPAFAFTTATGAATSTSATSLTNTGAAFPTSGQGLQGQIVVAYTATPSIVYGIIQSNTATVLTVDQWYNPASTTGAAGTTPSATGQYTILPGGNPASWMALTPTAITPAVGDTALSGELTASGFARAVGTYTHTTGATTYTLVHLWTAGATYTINGEAQFNAATVNAGDYMPFESVEPNPPTLVSGDTLQNTITVTV